MKYSFSTAIAVGAALVSSQSIGQQAYLATVCAPTNTSGYPDLDAPCNQVNAIQAQCVYGPEWLSSAGGGDSSMNNRKKRQSGSGKGADSIETAFQTQSNETQRICLCQSQFFDLANGCFTCYRKHGGDLDGTGGSVSEDTLASISSEYCAASTTPTAGLADYLFNLANSLSPEATPTSRGVPQSPPDDDTTSVSFADSIGNKTDVSLYYTPSVTGSAAWVLSQPTGESGIVSYSTTNVQDGQIAPTESRNNDAATERPSGDEGGSATRTGSGAQSTESGSVAARKEAMAAAGVVGLVGFVIVL